MVFSRKASSVKAAAEKATAERPKRVRDISRSLDESPAGHPTNRKRAWRKTTFAAKPGNVLFHGGLDVEDAVRKPLGIAIRTVMLNV